VLERSNPILRTSRDRDNSGRQDVFLSFEICFPHLLSNSADKTDEKVWNGAPEK
jgi:hypothetical protein